jgi:hypothetical protein
MKLVGRVITNSLPGILHIGTATHKQALGTGHLYLPPPGDTPDIYFLKAD